MSVDVLSMINAAVSDKEHLNQVTVLPLMCGSGKSTAISKLIKQTIKNLNEDGSGNGLLVVTDSLERLDSYLKPRDESVHAFLDEHRNQIIALERSNMKDAWPRIGYCPVLLMTTQRYFMLTREEIISFLTWKKGKRTLVVFDEQPYLFQQVDLTPESLGLLDSATFNLPDDDDFDYARIANEISETRIVLRMRHNRYSSNEISTKSLSEKSKHDPKEESLWVFTKPDQPYCEDKTDTQIDEEDIFEVRYIPDDTDDPETVKWYEDFIASSVDNGYHNRQKGKIFQKWQSTRKQLQRYNGKMGLLVQAYEEYLTNGGLYHYRNDGKHAVAAISILFSNKDKLVNLGSKVIILDATATITPDYNQDFIYIADGSAADRILPHLSIKLVNWKTNRKQTEKWIEDPRPTQKLLSYLQSQDIVLNECNISAITKHNIR